MNNQYAQEVWIYQHFCVKVTALKTSLADLMKFLIAQIVHSTDLFVQYKLSIYTVYTFNMASP
jgi:hypothetical protein